MQSIHECAHRRSVIWVKCNRNVPLFVFQIVSMFPDLALEESWPLSVSPCSTAAWMEVPLKTGAQLPSLWLEEVEWNGKFCSWSTYNWYTVVCQNPVNRPAYIIHKISGSFLASCPAGVTQRRSVQRFETRLRHLDFLLAKEINRHC